MRKTSTVPVLAAIMIVAVGLPAAAAATISIGVQSVATHEREYSVGFCRRDSSFRFLVSGVLRAGTNNQDCDAEERGVMLFELADANANGNPVLSATLSLNKSSGAGGLDLHGLAGVHDANFTNPIASGAFAPFGVSSVDVTAFIQALLTGAPDFVTFMLDDPLIATTGSAGSQPLRIFSPDPVLDIVFADATSVPAPMTALQLVTALGLCGWLGRRRVTSAPVP